MVTAEQLQSTLEKLLPRYPVMLAYLYGSVADKTAGITSDIDIALVLEQGTTESESLSVELAIAAKLDSSFTPRCTFDVRSIQSAPLAVQGEVITNGILLFSKREDMRVDFETYVRSHYFDMRPFYTAARTNFFESVIRSGLHG